MINRTHLNEKKGLLCHYMKSETTTHKPWQPYIIGSVEWRERHMGLLPDTQNWGLRMRRECRERFPRHRGLAIPDMHHGTCVTHVPWCMPGSLTCGFLWNRWQGKRSRHSWRMRNPRFRVSGKRPMGSCANSIACKMCGITCAMHRFVLFCVCK